MLSLQNHGFRMSVLLLCRLRLSVHLANTVSGLVSLAAPAPYLLSPYEHRLQQNA